MEAVGCGAVIESGLGFHGPPTGHPPVGPRHQVEAQHRLHDGPVAAVGVGQGQVDDLALQGDDREARPQGQGHFGRPGAAGHDDGTCGNGSLVGRDTVGRARHSTGVDGGAARHHPQSPGDSGLTEAGVEGPAVHPAGCRVEEGPSDRRQRGEEPSHLPRPQLVDETGAPAMDEPYRLVHDGVVPGPLGHQQ